MLFDPARHEPLTPTPWDEASVRGALARILGETNAAFTPQGLWPIHPQDISPERPPDCMKMLYNGAAGVIWALQELADRGHAPLAHDFLPAVRTLVTRHHTDLELHKGIRDYIGHEHDAYLFGETGLDLLEWKLAPAPAVEDRLAARIESKIGDNRGIVWGGAGTMHAARFLYEGSRHRRWHSAWRRHHRALAKECWFSSAHGCHLWTVDLYGIKEKRLGALHGYLANMGAILAGDLIASEQAARTLPLLLQALNATAITEGGSRNWPNSAEALKGAERPVPFVQHCNGPPGVVNSLAGLPADPETDALLLDAGELVWTAGPLAKMPSLCHGTPGNGYALLKLHARTGDTKWLDRARRFAMHAIAQSDTARAAHGQRKFSLWTGDLGLALYLADCLDARADFPTLDYF